jgi:Spy/CpxP family protein refolding chaperone
MKNILWVLFIILGMAGSGSAWAVTGNNPSPQDNKTKAAEAELSQLPRFQILKKLQLNNKQMDQLYTLRAHYRKTNAELNGKLQVKQVELENELENPQPDPLKVDQITGEIGVLYGQRIALKAKSNIELEHTILTPDQVEKLKELQSKLTAPESPALPKN